MIYDLQVSVTIRKKDEYRDSLTVEERAVIYIDTFPEIGAVMERFHQLIENVKLAAAVPKTQPETASASSARYLVENPPQSAPSE